MGRDRNVVCTVCGVRDRAIVLSSNRDELIKDIVEKLKLPDFE